MHIPLELVVGLLLLLLGGVISLFVYLVTKMHKIEVELTKGLGDLRVDLATVKTGLAQHEQSNAQAFHHLETMITERT